MPARSHFARAQLAKWLRSTPAGKCRAQHVTGTPRPQSPTINASELIIPATCAPAGRQQHQGLRQPHAGPLSTVATRATAGPPSLRLCPAEGLWWGPAPEGPPQGGPKRGAGCQPTRRKCFPRPASKPRPGKQRSCCLRPCAAFGRRGQQTKPFFLARALPLHPKKRQTKNKNRAAIKPPRLHSPRAQLFYAAANSDGLLRRKC